MKSKKGRLITTPTLNVIRHRVLEGDAVTVVRFVQSGWLYQASESCETLMPESRGSPASRHRRKTLPGAKANRVFDVTAAPMMVSMRLVVKSSDWMIAIGRR